MKTYTKYTLLLLAAGQLMFTSCKEDDKEDPIIDVVIDELNVPDTYSFKDANGNNTVDYSGQTTRLNMLTALIEEAEKGNVSGVTVSAATLKDLFANADAAEWGDAALNAATKQLKDKTLSAGVTRVEAYMDELELASKSTVAASNGVAGVLGGRLLSANGLEYAELIEKEIFTSCFFSQIVNSYLTDAKTGASVSNTDQNPANGVYYSTREHQFDEAFGYFGAPVDFPLSAGSFISKYSKTVDPILNTNASIMLAYRTGRAAIVKGNEVELALAKETLYSKLELVLAGSAIHYLSGANSNFGDDVKRCHQLSEAVGFLSGLSISPKAKCTPADVQGWKDQIGDNYWTVKQEDLIAVRNAIAVKYGISDTDRNAL